MSTVKEKAKLYLENDIIEQILAPSERLIIRELSDRYKLGLSPLREAVQELSHIGYIQYRPNFGACVTTLSLDELSAIIDYLAQQIEAKSYISSENPRHRLNEYQVLYHYKKLCEHTDVFPPHLPDFLKADEHMVALIECLIPTNPASIVQQTNLRALQILRRYLRLYSIHYPTEWRRILPRNELDLVVHKAVYSANSNYRQLLIGYLVHIRKVMKDSMILGPREGHYYGGRRPVSAA